MNVDPRRMGESPAQACQCTAFRIDRPSAMKLPNSRASEAEKGIFKA